MEKDEWQDRRQEERKDVYMPFKLFAKEHLASGHILNVSRDGVKSEIVFKTIEKKESVDYILSMQDVTVEIGGGGAHFHMKTTADIKWNTCEYGEGENIYRVGLQMRLTQEQTKEWETFYANI